MFDINRKLNMSNSWMFLPDRLSKEYKDGVKSFIEVKKNSLDGNNTSRCPCRDCQEIYIHDLLTVEKHCWYVASPTVLQFVII